MMAKKRLTDFTAITSLLADNVFHSNDSISNQDRKDKYSTIESNILVNANKEANFNTIKTDNVAIKFKKVTGQTDVSGLATIAHGLTESKIIAVAHVCFYKVGVPDASLTINAGVYTERDSTNIYIFTSSNVYGQLVDVNAVIIYTE